MDQIRINNLEVYCNHGVFPEENKLGQKFVVSCVMYVDTRKAGLTDELDASVHYGLVSHLLKKEMEENTFMLIERLAEHLAEKVLTYDDKIKKVDIEIKKPWAPIGLPVEYVSVKITRMWHEAFVAFGSNMGNKKEYLENAIEGLKNSKGCKVDKVSSIIETEPYGGVEQDVFLNGALKLRTLLTPEELLDRLHELEQEANRERLIHWGPRTLDLDILLYDNLVMESDELCIPHVDMQNRDFVLRPMAEIAPYKRHPVYGKTMKEMYAELE